MRHFATLALAALLLAPAALAQQALVPSSTLEAAPAIQAPGDTVVVSNLPDNAALTTFSDGNENYLFGTGSFGTEIFGSAYTFPEDGSFEVIGATLFVTVVPDAGETFDVSVYGGSLEDGPDGEALYSQTFDTDAVSARDGNSVSATVLFFDQTVEVETDVFFIVYDVSGVTSQFAAGTAGVIEEPTPETIVFADGAFARVDELFTTGEGPLQTYIFGDGIVLEVEGGDDGGDTSTLADARALGAGATVTIEGVVARAAGDFLYVQDETGGIAIRQTEGDVFDGVADGSIMPGTTVRVTGTLSEFNGLLQINEGDLADLEVTGMGDAPDAQLVTLAELAANGEDFEGELVTVTGVTVATTDTEFQARTTYDITDASDMTGAVTLRIPNADDGTADETTIPAGALSITGIVSQFDRDDPRDSGYQILLISAGDVMGNPVSVGQDPEGRLSLGAVAPNPSASTAAVTVTLEAAGPATVAVYDVLGREVAVVLDRALGAGDTVVDLEAGALAAGTYVVRLEAAGTAVVRPFTVVR